jgi:hypothetical protein
MVVTLSAALVSRAGPILILGSATWTARPSSVISRRLAAVESHGVWCATACCRWTSTFRADAKTVMSVASPAILTNLATPVAAAL